MGGGFDIKQKPAAVSCDLTDEKQQTVTGAMSRKIPHCGHYNLSSYNTLENVNNTTATQ